MLDGAAAGEELVVVTGLAGEDAFVDMVRVILAETARSGEIESFHYASLALPYFGWSSFSPASSTTRRFQASG